MKETTKETAEAMKNRSSRRNLQQQWANIKVEESEEREEKQAFKRGEKPKKRRRNEESHVFDILSSYDEH